MPHERGQRLYSLLDSLEALRLEFANGTEGEKAVIAAHGITKLREVRRILDTAIQSLKLTIGVSENAKPKARGAARASGRRQSIAPAGRRKT
jgi:hypothetical protein